MPFSLPAASTEYGFRVTPGGAHVGKTMMLTEVRLLFAASAPDADYAELRRLVLEDNVLLKATVSNRKEVIKRLTELYGLRRELVTYRSLRNLWQAAAEDQPLLALLCALARDTILRATADPVLSEPVGGVVEPAAFAVSVEACFPERYSLKTKLSISRNAAASWTQAGHLTGAAPKVRAKVTAGPASAAYALLLGHLCGARGGGLFETEWVRVLDATPSGLDGLAFAASRRGWVDYRRVGNVVEVGFSHLMGK